MMLTLLAGGPHVAGSASPTPLAGLPTLADVSVLDVSVLADVSAGGYVSLVKAGVLLAILLLWCRLLAWADKDAPAAHLPRFALNGANLGGLILAYGLVFVLPLSFYLIVPIILLILAAEVAVYLHLRNKVVGLRDLKRQWADFRAGLTPKKKGDAPGAVQLIGKAGPLAVPAGDAADRGAYEAVQAALTEPLRKGADQIDLTPASADKGMGVKYLVDCVSYSLPAALDVTAGAEVVAYVKGAAGLNLDEKRKPQKGKLKLTIDGEKREAEVQTAGTTAGEFLRLMLNVGKRHALKLPELGFNEAQLATVKASIKDRTGVVLLATPKGQGLTQLMYGMMRGHDAFMEHMQSVERDAPEVVEGITPNPLPASATPDEEAKKIDWMMSQGPDVIMVDRLESPQSATTLINFGLGDEDTKGKRSYIGMRTGSAAEAIEQWRKLSAADARGLAALNMVVCGRVLRKLCDACKESYTPDPVTLRKLNLNPEKVTTLFKARETSLRDPKGNVIPCEFCKDMKFKGRTGVFEVLPMTDELRAAIAADMPGAAGKLGSNFKAAFRKAKGKHLQEEALALVEKGETSVQEVLRVLKAAEEPAARPAAAAGAAPARPAGAARPAAAAGAPRAGPPAAPKVRRPTA
jgi:type II secretory ATPase GspE/PulE/Tfp pilus assembly ATPase PilB-like protein